MRSLAIKVMLIVGLGLTITLTGWSAKKLETESIHLRGSNNVTPIAQKIAEKYMKENPGSIVTVSSTGTLRGINSLINATSNIAMASADYTEEEAKNAKDNEITLTEYMIAKDALIPIINKQNNVSDLTLEQLSKIFSGEITNWQAVGGANEEIIVVSHDGATGNHETWKERVLQKGKVVTPQAKIMVSDAMKAYIVNTKGAIGYLGLSYMDGNIKTLTVDGVSADEANIKSGKYPIVRYLKIYTTQHATESVKKFIAYFQSDDKLNPLLKEAGVLPVK